MILPVEFVDKLHKHANSDDVVSPGAIEAICKSHEGLRDVLQKLLNTFAGVRRTNTADWMEYARDAINKAAETIGDSDRVALMKGYDGLYIVSNGEDATIARTIEIMKQFEELN